MFQFEAEAKKYEPLNNSPFATDEETVTVAVLLLADKPWYATVAFTFDTKDAAVRVVVDPVAK